MSLKQLQILSQKDQIQESLNEYLTIFNIYKQFHKKPEEKKEEIKVEFKKEENEKSAPPANFDNQLSDLAMLIAIS